MDARAMVRPWAYAAVVLASHVVVSCTSAPEPRAVPTTAAPEITPTATVTLSSRYREMADRLASPDVDEAAKLSLVSELGEDTSGEAMQVLLGVLDSRSSLVAAAAIMGLRRRPCAPIESALVAQLAKEDWQRRAWAAKVLGTNRCRGAVDALTEALQAEQDGRAQSKMDEALADIRKENPE
jgi:hypothetical protein